MVSSVHGCAIDVRACVAYITQDRAGVIAHYERSFVHAEHADAVREMAGECVFLQANTGLSEACGLLRRAFMLRVLPLMSTTHRVEAAVREAALAAAAANRGEGAASEVVCERNIWLRVKQGVREQRQKQQEANGKEKTRGSASSAEITAAAVGAALNEHALTEGDLRVLRKRAQEEGTTTDKRQHDYLDRMRASYEQQVQRTRSADSRRARAQDRPPSTHTLTIETAGLPGAQKIKLNKKDTEGGLNVEKAVAELQHRNVPIATLGGLSGPARKKEVQALLSKHCQLTGYPGFFKFSMPVQLQQAHDELAHVRRMKMDELKQKASDVTGDDSGSKTELIARITDAVLENAAT